MVTDEFTRWSLPPAAIHCSLLTVEHALSRGHVTSSATAVSRLPGQGCAVEQSAETASATGHHLWTI